MTTKYLFFTGGVVSSVGKGVTAAAMGLLLKERGLSEEEVYALMRKVAMSENLRLGQVAQIILTGSRFLK